MRRQYSAVQVCGEELRLLKIMIVLVVVFGYLLVARLIRGVPSKRRRR